MIGDFTGLSTRGLEGLFSCAFSFCLVSEDLDFSDVLGKVLDNLLLLCHFSFITFFLSIIFVFLTSLCFEDFLLRETFELSLLEESFAECLDWPESPKCLGLIFFDFKDFPRSSWPLCFSSLNLASITSLRFSSGKEHTLSESALNVRKN